MLVVKASLISRTLLFLPFTNHGPMCLFLTSAHSFTSFTSFSSNGNNASQLDAYLNFSLNTQTQSAFRVFYFLFFFFANAPFVSPVRVETFILLRFSSCLLLFTPMTSCADTTYRPSPPSPLLSFSLTAIPTLIARSITNVLFFFLHQATNDICFTAADQLFFPIIFSAVDDTHDRRPPPLLFCCRPLSYTSFSFLLHRRQRISISHVGFD